MVTSACDPDSHLRTSLHLTMLVLLIYGGQMSLAQNWEVKTFSGDSYSPQRYAVSLFDHNSAFMTTEYCMDINDNGGSIIGYVSELCAQCPTCVWKTRDGFTTEAEWQASVTTEMERLEGDAVPGAWIVEAPLHMPLNDTIIDEFASSLGISMENDPIISETGDRSYFMVSGTSSRVRNMISAGFSSVTPMPPRLKVEPTLEEEAAASVLPSVTGGGTLRSTPPPQQQREVIHGLHVHLTPRPSSSPPQGGLLFANNNSNSTAAGGVAAGLRAHAQRLSASWANLISTRLGHDKAMVVAQSDHHITIGGLANKAELYLVALDIAAHGGVKWISRRNRVASSNLFASQLVQSGDWWAPDATNEQIPDIYHPLSALGLTGKGEVIGVADTGLDWNSCYFRDDNITPTFKWTEAERKKQRKKHNYEKWGDKKHRKIRQYVAYMNAEEDVEERDNGGAGHGTHVCGSVAGSPEPLDIIYSEYSGVAPDAKIAFFDRYSKTEPEVSGLPSDVSEHMFPHAYGVGARVYVLSFNEVQEGGAGTSPMSTLAKQIDLFCFKNPDFVVFVSAGNTNNEGGRQKTISVPAEAKNAVTVGSHYNPDQESAPKSHYLQIAPTSASGPTFDGRIKPDVCGPGNSVYSAAASSDSKSCSTEPKSGTSSANAIVAGAAVLVRQYFTQGYYPNGAGGGFTPSGALIKAILINSAKQLDLDGGTNHLLDDELAQLNAYSQGWGGVDLSSTLVTPSSDPGLRLKVYSSDSVSLAGPVVKKYIIKVNDDGGRVGDDSDDDDVVPLKITLVWYDRPGGLTAKKGLVNNLDLTVIEERKSNEKRNVYYGNFGSRKRGDKRNTVEHIEIPYPTPNRRYIIEVKAKTLPHQRQQSYALVISGPFDDKKIKKG